MVQTDGVSDKATSDDPGGTRASRGGQVPSRSCGPSPKQAVRREVLRAAGALALAPFRALPYLLRRNALERALWKDLEQPAVPDTGPDVLGLPERPLSILVSSAEHSGEVHAANLVRAMRAEIAGVGGPAPRFHGLGGERLIKEGVEQLDDPIAHAAMGADVLRSLPYYLGLFERTATFLREERPDLFLPVDSPALHVPLAHMAKRYGVPVVHYVTPQYWAWAPWRVHGYRRAVDLGLTILPFEPAWFQRHGVRTAHVGHPQVDELADRTPASSDSGSFVAHVEESTEKRLVLLPGSRRVVIQRNLPWMLACAERVRRGREDLQVVLAHDDPKHERLLREILATSSSGSRVQLELGELHDSLGKADAALSVSGTILLDLLHHRLPTAVIYRLERKLSAALSGRFLSVPWFSSLNLLAGHEVVPEACFAGEGPLTALAEYLGRALDEPAFRARIRSDLDRTAERLGPAGAPRRAARHALSLAIQGVRSH